MFENIINFFKKLIKTNEQQTAPSKDTAKERLHLVLMQDRANMSADFLELMKQEIIEVIKKYVDVQEEAIDVRLTNKVSEDGTNGAPFLYANIPVVNIKHENVKNDSAVSDEPKKDEKPKTKNTEPNKHVGVGVPDDPKENQKKTKTIGVVAHSDQNVELKPENTNVDDVEADIVSAQENNDNVNVEETPKEDEKTKTENNETPEPENVESKTAEAKTEEQ